MDHPSEGSAREARIYSVSALNREVKLLLDAALPGLQVEGEVSRVSRPASGHLYFVLKDAEARVDAVIWRTAARRLAAQPEEGMQVLVRGRIGLYEPQGRYQLYVDHLEEAGEGALQRRFEELKRKLAAEGLFDQLAKQAIPTLPRRIGVVTSTSTAALQDVLRVLARRMPSIAVVVYPTPVQGREAADGIVAALEAAGRRAECDLLIVCRGGGSLEDLWSFNEEAVVRAVAACPIPIISGVGHEIDHTLTDLAADLRAPTPSGAAELASPDRRELAARLLEREQRLRRAVERDLGDRGQRLDLLQRQLPAGGPLARLTRAQERLIELAGRSQRAWRATRQHAEDRLRGVVRALEAISPLATLARGYAILLDGERAVRSTDEVAVGDALTARLGAGALDVEVKGKRDAD